MAKGRIGLYEVKGETLTRTHKSCPKCGPGAFLAEHENRRSCGRCGYSETKAVHAPAPVAPKGKPAKGGPSAKVAPPPPAKP